MGAACRAPARAERAQIPEALPAQRCELEALAQTSEQRPRLRMSTRRASAAAAPITPANSALRPQAEPQDPISAQGADDFPAAFGELRARLHLTRGPLALVGESIGSLVAQLVLAESGPAAGIAATAVVLVSPITQLRAAVDATARRRAWC